MHDVLQQLGCLLGGCGDEGLVLNPLEEFVDGDVYIFETSKSWLERPDHVQSPACEGPRCVDGLKGLCWHMYLLGKKLTSFTMLDEVFCIGDGRGPVKTSSKSFADQVSRSRVIAVEIRVNFEK